MRAGEALALVGENGAGKTTLVKLLARLDDPDEGRILLDGVDLRDYDLDSLRSGVGVIFQDFVRYHLSASENIAVGRIDQREDRPRIETAAQRSLADAVIDALPGEDTIRRWASDSRTASICRAGSGRRSHLAWANSATPNCSSSTSRRPLWMRALSTRCSSASKTSRRANPRS